MCNSNGMLNVEDCVGYSWEVKKVNWDVYLSLFLDVELGSFL